MGIRQIVVVPSSQPADNFPMIYGLGDDYKVYVWNRYGSKWELSDGSGMEEHWS